ncbi:MAG TPA: ATP-binding protein, partial [Candidatus Limnocylindrales bacterium]|nr:ATP-binding protein [Candidatus Limnocylindrales bacterium]
LLLGATAVALPRFGRAWRKARASGSRSLVDTLIDEFVPRLGGGRLAAEAERARLAADLHARVVPELRQAVEAASAGSSPEITGRLRSTLDDVEQLMATRHSVLLDELGLVAGLEWLAERTEARAGVVVTVEIDAASGDARPPLAAERAAFRIAVLAVDNAVRHAAGSPITIAVTTTPDRLSLVVLDTGPGFDPAVARGQAGEHRGLVDMRAESDAVGARLQVDANPVGGAAGTAIGFDWPTPRLTERGSVSGRA